MSEATTGVPAANASVRTIPNDSPPSDGAHSRSAARSARLLRGVVDAAERGHALALDQQRRELLGGRADHDQLGRHLAAQRLEGAQQHGQALALDGLADERDPQRLAGRAPARRRRPALGHDDAVRDHAVAAAVEAPAGPGRGLGDRDAHVEVVELAPGAQQRGDLVRRDRLRVAVERPHKWRVGARQGVPTDGRRDRLVDVDDVEIPRAQLAPQRRDARRRAREIGDRAVGRPADRAAERHQPLAETSRTCGRAPRCIQRRPAAVGVERREHLDVVPGAVQLDGESFDVAGYAAGVCPRVRGYKGHPHAAIL